MTNNYIKALCAYFAFSRNEISWDTNDFIMDNYDEVDRHKTNGRWYMVYRKGSDSYRNAYMINPETKEWRMPTFTEYYTGSTVN